MQLDFETIKSITCGAVDFTVEEDRILFHRFTKAQFDMYEKKNIAFFDKSKTAAGVKLSFRTDSRILEICAEVKNARSRTYFSFDVFVDNRLIGSMENFSQVELPQDYSGINFPVGQFRKRFELGQGIKTVTVQLPWNKITKIIELHLDDGAKVIPVKAEKKMLVFGDSISAGFDALYTSRRYVAQLASYMGVDEYNKCIGGERYCPDLAALRDDFTPDYILVAYGTNDWSSTTPETFHANVKAFFEQLDIHYPGVKTFVVTPIWRVNYQMERPFSSFFEIEEGIRAAVAGRASTYVFRGFDYVPHSVDYFGDYGLHPNMAGCDLYAKNLFEELKEHL